MATNASDQAEIVEERDQRTATSEIGDGLEVQAEPDTQNGTVEDRSEEQGDASRSRSPEDRSLQSENTRLREENLALRGEVDHLRKGFEALEKTTEGLKAALERSEQENARLEGTWRKKLEEQNAFWEWMLEQTGVARAPSEADFANFKESKDATPREPQTETSQKETSLWNIPSLKEAAGKLLPTSFSLVSDNSSAENPPTSEKIPHAPSDMSWQELMDEDSTVIAGLEWQVESLQKQNAELKEKLKTSHVEKLIQVNYLMAEKLSLEERLGIAGQSDFSLPSKNDV